MGIPDKIASALGIQYKPTSLSRKAVSKLAHLSHELASLPEDKVGDFGGPLQLRHYKGGIHVAPFKDTPKRRKEHDKARTLIQAHLHLPKNCKDYGSAEAGKAALALSWLNSSGFTRKQLDEALTPVSNVQFAGQVKAAGSDVIKQAGQLRRNGAPRASADLPDGDTTADDFAEKTKDRLDDYHKRYRFLCLPQPSDNQRKKREKEPLKNDFKKAFNKHPLTKRLKLSPATLYQKVLEEPCTRIDRMSKRLEALTSLAPASGTLAEQQAHAERVQQCSDELKQAIADWSELLAVVGTGLTQLAFDQSGKQQEALIQLAAGLIAQGQVVQLPDGYYMALYRSASDAGKRAGDQLDRLALRDSAERLIAWAKAQGHRAAHPVDTQTIADLASNSRGMSLEKSSAQTEQEAKAAAHAFAAMFQDESLGIDPQRMQEAIEAALSGMSATKALSRPGSDLVRYLFEDFPSVLDGLVQRAEQATQDARANDGQNSLYLQNLAAEANAKVMVMESRYIEVLTTVGDALVNVLDSSSWSDEQRARVHALGFALVAWAKTMAVAGPNRARFVQAQQRCLEARRRADSLPRKPAPTVEPEGVKPTPKPQTPKLVAKSASTESFSLPTTPREDRSQLELPSESHEDTSLEIQPEARTDSRSESQYEPVLTRPTSTPEVSVEQPARTTPVQGSSLLSMQDPAERPVDGLPRLALRSRRLKRTDKPVSPRRSAPQGSMPPFEKIEPTLARRGRSLRPARNADPTGKNKSVQFAEVPELVSGPVQREPLIPPPPRRPENALAEFVQKAFTPPGGADALDEDQQRLQSWLNLELKKLFTISSPEDPQLTTTRALEASQLAKHLDGMLAGIQKVEAALRTQEQKQAAAVELLALSDQLLHMVDAYVAQYAEVARLLKRGSTAVGISEHWRKQIEDAGQSMDKHLETLSSSQGWLQKTRAWARELQLSAAERLTPKAADPVQPASDTLPNAPLPPVSRPMTEAERNDAELQALLGDLSGKLAGDQ